MADLKSTVTSVIDPHKCQYAIVPGVLIHGPDDTHYFWTQEIEITTNATSQRAPVCRSFALNQRGG